MAEVASAFVSILPSARGFGSKLNSQVSGQVSASGKKSGALWGKVFGAVAGLAIGRKAISFLGDSLAEAREAQKVGAQTEAVIRSTGKAAGITAEDISKMAGRLSNLTGIDDEAIQSGENLLLTFTNVRNFVDGQFTGTFDSATQVMVDMSAALGQDMKSSAIQVGKALNDPIKGVTALTRVGVSFTEQQKEQIKTLVESGKTTQAQGLILGELTKEFGGSAEAQATASDKARVAVGNLKEQIGTALLPTIDRLSNFVTTKVVPAVSTFITGMQDGTGAGGRFAGALKDLWNRAQDVYNALVPVVSFLIENKEATSTFAGVILTVVSAVKVWSAAQLLLNAALTANPIGLVVVAIAALAAGFVYVYKRSETFRAVVNASLRAVGAVGRWLWNSVLQPTFSFILNAIGAIIEAVADMFDALSNVPGFGWAKDAADKMHGAADAAHGLADSIQKIPNRTVTVNVMVNTSAIAKAEAQLDRLTAHAANNFPRSPVKEGPLKAFNKYGGIGGALMANLTEGLKRGTPAAKNALGKVLDKLKDRLKGFRDDMKSLAESVSSAFTQDLFGGNLADLFSTGTASVAALKASKAALKTLKGFGASDSFIKSLFESGNTALISQLAGSDRATVQAAQSLFGEQNKLADQLGSRVGQTVLGDEIRGVRKEIRELRKDLKHNAREFGRELNAAARRSSRDSLRWDAAWA